MRTKRLPRDAAREEAMREEHLSSLREFPHVPFHLALLDVALERSVGPAEDAAAAPVEGTFLVADVCDAYSHVDPQLVEIQDRQDRALLEGSSRSTTPCTIDGSAKSWLRAIARCASSSVLPPGSGGGASSAEGFSAPDSPVWT
jgi:hypothetical protein